MYVAEQTLRVALGIDALVLIPAHRLIKKTTFEKHRIGRSSGEHWYFTTAGTTQAQVAGSTTTIGSSVQESTKLAMGWRVKITILGKTVYDSQGQKVGTVQGLIISPDRNVSYAIVGKMTVSVWVGIMSPSRCGKPKTKTENSSCPGQPRTLSNRCRASSRRHEHHAGQRDREWCSATFQRDVRRGWTRLRRCGMSEVAQGGQA